jgi:hypothetical protein
MGGARGELSMGGGVGAEGRRSLSLGVEEAGTAAAGRRRMGACRAE